jgi:ribosomal protein L22
MAVERKKEEKQPSAGTPAGGPAKGKPADAPTKDKPAEAAPKRKPSGESPKRKPAGAAAKAKAEPAAKAGEQPKPARRRAPGRRRSAEPAAAESTRTRAPEVSRPVVRAQAKYVRSSARKARLVIEHIRGRSVEDARAILRHTPRGVAADLEKLLKSAVANAENNHDLVGDDLVIKDVYADEGPTIKRFRPRAMGRATRIRKRTSHLTLTLTPKD